MGEREVSVQVFLEVRSHFSGSVKMTESKYKKLQSALTDGDTDDVRAAESEIGELIDPDELFSNWEVTEITQFHPSPNTGASE